MDLVRDPYTGQMVDRRTGLPVDGMSAGAVPAARVNFMDRLLAGSGVSERIMAAHQLFNPVTALAEAGQQSQIMLDPATNPMGRVAALGGMLTGMAGTVAPMWAASRGAVPTANAMVDALTGINMPGGEFMADEFGGVKMPGAKDGITAYHGSPHSFDKFSMDKIGTGEGAQAYGHGLYFAENEGVAKGYRDALSQNRPTISGTAADMTDPEHGAAYFVQQHGGDRSAAIAEMERMFRDGEIRPHETTLADGVLRRLKSGDQLPDVSEQSVPGSMYEVRINANPDDFLDWDKPLSEQPAKVREAADVARKAYLKANYPDRPEFLEGGFPADLIDGIPSGRAIGSATAGGATSPTVAAGLREAGIPGIKYLDAGSRGAGDGSRNYVVFDENLIEIVKKYGIAGAAAMLGVTAMDVEQAMAGQK